MGYTIIDAIIHFLIISMNYGSMEVIVQKRFSRQDNVVNYNSSTISAFLQKIAPKEQEVIVAYLAVRMKSLSTFGEIYEILNQG